MDYINMTQQALDYIEENLEEKLTLQDISREIYISPYHFSRIFKAILGVTISEYIKMRRLSLAATLLSDTDKRIIEIAFMAGFESQESFSKAFKSFFSYTPYSFRKNKPKVLKYSKKELYLANLKIKNLKGSAYMNYKIVERDEIKLVGIKEKIYLQKENTIPKLWKKFFLKQGEIKNKVNGNYYGVSFNMKIENNLAKEVTTEAVCEFDEMIGVEVSSFDHENEDMFKKIIPPQKYLVFTYKGSLNDKDFVPKVQKTYDYLYGSLLPATEFQVDKEFNFELCDERFKENDDNSEFDIYIPIK